MPTKAPAMLLVWIETANLRWFVASLGLDGRLIPLLCSEVGDLDLYRGLEFDHQVSFLRHRFCGILQRGCDRLWPRGLKACQFVLLFESPLPEPTGALTLTVARHFAEWMLNPPVALFDVTSGPPWKLLGGTIDAAQENLLRKHFDALRALCANETAWEVSHQKSTFAVEGC